MLATDPVDRGHLLPPDEWARVVREAEHIARTAAHAPETLGPSAFPSVTGYVQAKYDGGQQPEGRPYFGIVHDAETPLANGYALGIANYFTRNTNETSAHFMAGPDALYQLLDTSLVAWHCGNGNTRSVAVEQAGYATTSAADWTSPAAGLPQMRRVAALLRDLKAAHGIGLYHMTDPAEILACWRGEHVGGWITHHQASTVIGGSDHTDPDPNYPIDALMGLANQEDDVPLTDDEVRRIADAVLFHDIKGINLFNRLYGIDAIQLPNITKAVAAIPTAPSSTDPKALATAILAQLPATLAHQVVAEMGNELRTP